MRPQIPFGLALFGAIFLPGAAQAQAGGHTAPSASDTVRVSWTASGHRALRHEGVVVDAGPDAILLDTSDGVRTIPANAVTGVEYARARTGWEGFKRGFTVGGLVFGLGGVVVGGVAGASCDGDFLCPGPAGGAAILGTMFGVGGGIVGGLLKAYHPGIEWRDSPLHANVRPAPGGGAELGLRVSF